jgi:hypothetical protein
MKNTVFAAFSVLALASCGESPGNKLIGEWDAVSEGEHLSMVVESTEKVTFIVGDRFIKWSYKIDWSKKPPQLEFRNATDPDDVIKGIIEFAGNNTFRMRKFVGDERLVTFDSDPMHTTVFKRKETTK